MIIWAADEKEYLHRVLINDKRFRAEALKHSLKNIA
jgi:hypothetical protein